jgi:hypothetical protein
MDIETRQDDDLRRVQETSTRAGFLRRLGTTVAVGFGVALIPVSKAWAPSAWCCIDTSCPSCGTGEYQWRCWECGGGNCCQCQTIAPPPENCRWQLPCGVCG